MTTCWPSFDDSSDLSRSGFPLWQVLYFGVPSDVSLNAQALCDEMLTSNARDCV
jgi:hypothetical protein